MQHLLIVDDDQDTRDAIVWKLQKERVPVEIDTAVTGDDALMKLQLNTTALMLLDVRIPGKDGFQVLEEVQRIRETGKLKNLKIIVFTNMGQNSTLRKALELGADKAFLKAETSINEVTQIIKENLA